MNGASSDIEETEPLGLGEPKPEPCQEHCFCMATFSFPPKVTCCRCGETRTLLARIPKGMQPRLAT
jgi:hypothetical protein